MKVESGIYMIVNVINNKCYIGSTKNFRKRKYEHFKDLINNKHHSQHLQNAYNKYGKESFHFIELEQVEDLTLLIDREIHWMKLKDSIKADRGYNVGIPKRGEGLNCRPSTILKLREAAYNQFYKNNPRISLEDFLNGKRAKDLKEKLGYQNKKKVLCFDCKTGEKKFEFDSIADCAKYFNVVDKYLRRVIDIENKTFRKLIIVSESNFDPSKNYVKTYKTVSYTPKGTFKGNSVETYNLETLEVIDTYDNLYDAAEKLNTSKRYLQKVLYGERKSFKGMGIRLNKKIQAN